MEMQILLAYILTVEKRSDFMDERVGDEKNQKRSNRGTCHGAGRTGSRYLGHFLPSSGTAKNIANSLIEFCKDKQIDISKIQAIGCDGTNTNVGWKTGVIRRNKI